MVREGNYGLNPHQSGKYFFYDEDNLRRFADAPDNSHIKALTEVELPDSAVQQGRDLKLFGEGRAVHFTDEQLLEMYDGMSLPSIIDSKGIPIIGGGD